MRTATVHGFIRAVADSKHPLQTQLSLILTDFAPNKNKQGIPESEAEAIMQTALQQPVKINFDGFDYNGHPRAIPIGPIVNTYRGIDNGVDVIYADAVIWNSVYTDIAEHLKLAFAEGIGTSWEIYYDHAVVDEYGVEWLQGCVFDGTCIVKSPAYGPNRTRILAIAEELNKLAENTTEIIMTKPAVNSAQADDTTETLRADINNVLEVLTSMYGGLYQMLDETHELEQQLVTTDMSAMAEQFSKLVTSISDRFETLKSKVATAETVEQELVALKNTIAETAEAAKLEERKNALRDVGITYAEERKTFFLAMDDTAFAQYIADLKAVKSQHASAEQRQVVIPDVVTQSPTFTVKELAAILRGE